MRTADWTDSVSVLDRVTAVFDAFGEDDEGLGVSELARRANLPKSTVSRIAADLVGQRFLERDGDKFTLGVRLFELAITVEEPRRLRHLALPVMTELREVTGRAVNLAVLEGPDVVFLMTVRADPAEAPSARVGGRLPAYATALGKAILAFSPPAAVERVIEGGLHPRTRWTISDASEFRRELTGIRRLGVATEKEECVLGRACVASPVLGPGGVPIAAISVAGSAASVVPERMASAVRAAGITLGRRIEASRTD
ncbi:IclR family transcriptional regulator [Agromyces salentinus]|uniref:IclR family transcriptional regulator n=1 Tax=Agromyces salentinus TaxID=269421 RepID=A0ABN2MRK9_9MICO|nr:IclR family transcriptional regulator [Agromyces salentinus]